MIIYYAGFNPTSLYSEKCTIETFTRVPFDNATDVYIDWNYLLLWRGNQLWITGAVGSMDEPVLKNPREIVIPDNSCGRYLCATGTSDSITILTSSREIWRYMIYENVWKRVSHFMPSNEDELIEEIVKIDQGKVVVALTNLGRVFNVPGLVDMPEEVEFVDVSCGIEHTLMLAASGDVYSMGLGTRGQLGHGDLEDSDEPKLIEALAGLKVSQISASGWCSAAVTREGDLYLWGWNNEGQMGLDNDQKVVAVPTVIDFKNEDGSIVEINIIKVQCTSSHIVCLTDNGELWGCGSNKYGQLGQEFKNLSSTKTFIRLPFTSERKKIKDIKCRTRGTFVIVSEAS